MQDVRRDIAHHPEVTFDIQYEVIGTGEPGATISYLAGSN